MHQVFWWLNRIHLQHCTCHVHIIRCQVSAVVTTVPVAITLPELFAKIQKKVTNAVKAKTSWRPRCRCPFLRCWEQQFNSSVTHADQDTLTRFIAENNNGNCDSNWWNGDQVTTVLLRSQCLQFCKWRQQWVTVDYSEIHFWKVHVLCQLYQQILISFQNYRPATQPSCTSIVLQIMICKLL